MKKTRKKASIPAAVVVSVIIGLLLLIIGLFFYERFQSTDVVDKQACHESIILRHSLNVGPLEPGRTTIPLQCQTEKICMTSSSLLTTIKGIFTQSAKCKPFSDSRSGLKKVQLSGTNEEIKQKAIAQISDAMAGCWKTVGEGLLDYSPRGQQKEAYCSICARIAFDENIQKNIPSVSYREIFEYMERTQVPSSTSTKQVSYLKFIYNRETLKSLNEEIKERVAKNQLGDNGQKENYNLFPGGVDLYSLNVDTSKEYAVITKFQKEGWNLPSYATIAGGAVGATAGLIVVTALTGGIGTVIIATIAGGAIAGGTVIMSEKFNDIEATKPALILYPTELNRFKCTSFEWKQ